MGGRNAICGDAVGTSFEARRWLALDVCGLLGVGCSWAVHLFALAVAGGKLLPNNRLNTILFFGAYVPAAALAMASLYRAWTTDPGAVPMGARPLVTVRRASSIELSPDPGGNASCGDATATATPPPRRRRPVRRCHKCGDNYKPARAHHDSVTGRCVVKFDHFCPWVGNAIGALNHKFFCLFLLWTAVSCLLALTMLVVRAVQCGYIYEDGEDEAAAAAAKTLAGNPDVQVDDKNSEINHSHSGLHQQRYQPHRDGNGNNQGHGRWLLGDHYVYAECATLYEYHLVLALFIASLVFLVFTCSMGCEQLEAIETGRGKIARMKMRVGDAGTEFRRVTEEFNEMFGGDTTAVQWHWFLPMTVRFPRGMKKVVLGYDYDESFPAAPYQEDDDYEEDGDGGSIGGFGSPSSASAAAAAREGGTELQDLEAGEAAPGSGGGGGDFRKTKLSPVAAAAAVVAAEDAMMLRMGRGGGSASGGDPLIRREGSQLSVGSNSASERKLTKGGFIKNRKGNAAAAAAAAASSKTLD